MENNNVKKNYNIQQELNILDILKLCLSRWYWFVISIIIFLALAFLYVKRSVPTYSNSAQVLIKENKKARSMAADVSAVADMGLFASNTNVYNEIVSMSSPRIMQEVVRRLGIDVSYNGDGFWYKPVLYGNNLPFTVKFLSLTEKQSASLEVDMKNKGGFVLSNFYSNTELAGAVNGNFDDTLSTPVGDIVVSKGPGYFQWEEQLKQGLANMHFYVSKGALTSVAGSYSGKLTIDLNNKENTVVDIRIVDQSVQRAEDIINSIIIVYNESWVEDKNLIAISTSHFINNRLEIIEKDLGMVDNSISEFKGENRIPDLQAAAQMYMQRSEATSNELMQLNTTLSVANYLFNFMSRMSTDDVLPSINGLGNSNIESQISEYNERVITREKLIASSSETNTVVLDYNKAINSLRGAILSSLNNYMISLKSQISTLEKMEKSTNSQLAGSPKKAQELLSIERQQKVKEALYLFLLQKREENELTQTFTAYNNRIITPAHGGGQVTPKTRNIYLIALLLALAFPAGFLIAREMLDTKVRVKSDLDNMTVPFAGEIPQGSNSNAKKWWQIWKSIDSIEENKALMVVKEGKRDFINESFRVLRSNLELMSGNKKGVTFLLTSFEPGSGKSFLSMNIAMVFALKHNNVLVIDCDLRHGSTSEYVGSPKKGLSSLLTGRIEYFEDVLVNYENNEHLFVLPIGIIPPNPSELLYSRKFKEIIEDTKNKFDYVILDCPPVNMLADTQIISPYADRSILVVRAGLMEKKQLSLIDELTENKKFNNLSIILNASRSDGSNGGRYGYRYGYGYGYGYGYKYGYGYYGNKKNYYASFAESGTDTTSNDTIDNKA